MLSLLLVLITGYVIGGFPTGIILCKLIKGVDPRTIGSGSSGATNVSRTVGKKWAALVLIIDALKGYLPVKLLIPIMVAEDHIVAANLIMTVAIVVGHVWTPYAGFKGGKGVAASAGSLIALDPMSMLIALLVWTMVFAIFRIVSFASIVAALVLPVAMIVIGNRPIAYVVFASCLALFIVFTHRGNIARLLRKAEQPIL